ncbi:hypothetical protein GLYMA_04G059600v4 [Glycine max]|uniref:peroxidase n=1 Tax=Glycine max TaxID=3847 RepID=K7KIC7_SOYBN|nr:hypothetical protein GYH30_009079 [Glycine max]KRH61638.1 hypothetical protein GLYMA_04G059600v4 [Glycine max]
MIALWWDVSLMLQGNNTEQSDPGNRSVGGFSVIDSAKRILEKFCPRTVSCADIIALAAGDAVEIAGEPRTMIPTGAHTIGTAHCSSFRDHFQEDSKGNLRLIDKTLYSDYANELMKQCPAGVQPSVTVNNDPETSKVFDNMMQSSLGRDQSQEP